MSSQWRDLLKHLTWYLLAVVLLALLVYVLRLRTFWWLPWLVALAWGGALIFRFSRQDEPARAGQRLAAYLEQARAYKAQIDQVVKAAGGTSSLPDLAAKLNSWTGAIQELVERIRTLEQDKLIRRDRQAVPAAIKALEARLAAESEPSLRTQLERTLANRRKQLASLEELQTVVARAEIQLESTLSLLGTIYSQVLTGQSTSHVADYSRLSTDIDEEVRLLQDQLEALQEVKLGKREEHDGSRA